MLYGGVDHTDRLRRIVFILFFWAISLTLVVAIAAAEPLSFLDGHIRFYPRSQRVIIFHSICSTAGRQ